MPLFGNSFYLSIVDSAEKPPISENRVGQALHHHFCDEKTLAFLFNFPCTKISK